MSTPADIAAWNEAHERLRQYLETFALGDRVQLERIALKLLDEAQGLQRLDPSLVPVSITLRHAQARLGRWLAGTLTGDTEPSPPALAGGTIALLLSRLALAQPETFLADALTQETRESLRRTLVVTGPDLTVSSMTPRHLDYGPMLDLARQTWHRWDARSFATAVAFWLGVYAIGCWFLSEYL